MKTLSFPLSVGLTTLKHAVYFSPLPGSLRLVDGRPTVSCLTGPAHLSQDGGEERLVYLVADGDEMPFSADHSFTEYLGHVELQNVTWHAFWKILR